MQWWNKRVMGFVSSFLKEIENYGTRELGLRSIGIMEHWNVEDPAWRGWHYRFWEIGTVVYPA